MQPIRYIIVDDEPLARQALIKLLANIQEMQLVAECSNAAEALIILKAGNTDLLFLDINMPEITGLQLLKSLNKAPKVILTTAYSEYALDAFELGVADYLVKPIPFERLYKAINRLFERPSLPPAGSSQPAAGAEPHAENKFLFFKAEKVFIKFFVKDILYFEASGNFVKVHTVEKIFLVSETFSNVQSLVPPELFVRIHKSYIVSLQKINKVSGNTVYINNTELPLGETYRKDFLELLSKGIF